MSAQRFLLTSLLILALLAPGASQSLAQPAASQTAATPSTSGGSLLVVENAGQWPDAAHFQVWNSPLGPGTTWLAEDAIWLVVASGKPQVAGPEASADQLADLPPANLPPATLHALKLTFPGGNPDVRIEPFGPVDTTVSYFIGDDPAQWRPAAPVWSGVRYVDLYPGVDLVLGTADRFWRLEAQPGAATDQVQLAVEGAALASLADGTLGLTVDGEPLSLALPQAAFAYQVSGASHQGEPLTLAAPPAVHSRQQATPDDNPQDLIYRVMLRGQRWEYGEAVAVDDDGSAYVAGSTNSSNFPTTPGAFDPTHNGDDDVFVAKLNPTGSQLVYATFLGGRGTDVGAGIALDAAGSAYLSGYTRSSNFPTTPGAFETGFHGNRDAFAVKLSPDGSMLAYGTFLGGSNDDAGNDIAVDAAGSAYVVGSTLSADFPNTPGAFDPSYNFGVDDGDAFLLKLDATGSSLAYATFLGGGKTDRGYAIALDQEGSAYVTGLTYSSNFPATPDSFDPTYNYSGDAYVLKLNPAGSRLVYAGFLGGGWYDTGHGIAVDAAGSAHVTGYSACGDFPTTPGAFDRVCSGYYDAYAVKLDPTGSGLAYATLLGGSALEYGQAIAVSATGSAYVTGYTTSTDFPTTPYAYDSSHNGGYYDAFVAKLSAAGSGLAYATYFGAGNYDYGQAVAADGAGSVTVAGTCDRDVACVVRLAARGALTTAQWTAAPPSVDGSFDDWAPATPLLLDRDSAFYAATQPASSPPPDPTDSSAELRALWTATDLYFAISVRDDRIIADSPRVWNDDEIELAFVGALDFDPAGGDTHLYTVNADGRITDLYAPAPPVEAVAVPVAGGWNVELRIPASHLLGSATPLFSGKTLAFDLGLHDDDYGDVWDSFMIWAGDSLATPHAGGQLRLEGGPPPTPTPTNTPGATPTPTMTPTATATPTATPLPQPDLSTSSKAAWPAAAFHGQTILYYIDLRNTGRGTAQVTLLDAPPLPVIPNTAWGGLIWDAGAGTFRWHGYLVANDARSMGYSVSGPGICVPPGTVYTNTLRIYDGVQLAFTRSAQVVVDPGATPWAPCTPTVTPTPTATPTATATPTPTATPMVQFRYLPLLLRQES